MEVYVAKLEYFLKLSEEKQADMLSKMPYDEVKQLEDYCLLKSEVDALECIKKAEASVSKKFNSEYEKFDMSDVERLKGEIKVALNETLDDELFLYYGLSETERCILDEFFLQTNMEVIAELLVKIKEKVSNKNKFTNPNFISKVVAVQFPTEHYSRGAYQYLSDKYEKKIYELGLDEIGVKDVEIVHNPNTKTKVHRVISYEDENKKLSRKYNAHIYDLVVKYDINKCKALKKVDK